MDLKNKTFRNNETGETIKVIDSFENIAILENKTKIDSRRLLNPTFFTEQIDPSSFFDNQSAYNILADKIKNIPTEGIIDDPTEPVQKISVDFANDGFTPPSNESAIIMTTEEDEREELARKYGFTDNSVVQSVQKQNEYFSNLIGDDDEFQPIRVPESAPVQKEEVQQIIVNREGDVPVTQPVSNQTPKPKVDDPIITMFRNVKRNTDLNISLEINNKIPRADFIEMMEDSYNTSIIEFLADEFTQNLLDNPDIIKNLIKDKINEIVYGKNDSVNNQITDAVTTEVNPQITDSVTQVSESVKKTKSNTVRKSTKKESVEK